MNMIRTIMLGTILLGSTLAFGERPPPDAKRARAVRSLDDLIDQTAAVVEARVCKIDYTMSVAEPETLVTLCEVKTLMGTPQPVTLTIRQKGGQMANGRFQAISHVPVFVEGETYVVFLRNTEWHLSPVVDGHALLVKQVGGAETLIDQAGHGVEGLDGAGLKPSMEQLVSFDPQIHKDARVAFVANIRATVMRARATRASLVNSLRTELLRKRKVLSGRHYDEPLDLGGAK